MKKVLGVDVGGVIIASRQGDRDTFFNLLMCLKD